MFRFWKAVMLLVHKGYVDIQSDDDCCFELANEDLSESIPDFHPERLMKDEGIDGRNH